METTTSRQATIVCMGGTGTGKTTFVNLVGGSNYGVGDDLESCTNRVQPHQFTLDGCDVTLVDMPGFDDTSKSDSDLLRMIADFLLAEYQKERMVNGVLYFHRISDVRVGGASKRNFIMFKRLCGEDVFENVAIVTTRWDLETEAIGNKRLKELISKPQLFKSLIDGRAKIFKHDRTEESGRKVIRHLINREPKPLLIQREMAEGKEVLETTAGQELQREIMEQVEKHQKDMVELLEEMEQTHDEAGLGELEEECRALRDRMARLQAESQKLAGIPNVSELEPPMENTPVASNSPSESALVVATNVPSITEQPRTTDTIPLGAAIGEIREELRAIETQLEEEKLHRERDHKRLEDVEKQLVGMVTIPTRLLAVWNRVLMMFAKSK